MVDWNVRKKRWWFGYGFKGDKDHVDYTYGLYEWGVYQMFFFKLTTMLEFQFLQMVQVD
jgi:hypothetical protein